MNAHQKPETRNPKPETILCPACEHLVDKLVGGVCVKCKDGFRVKHGAKTDGGGQNPLPALRQSGVHFDDSSELVETTEDRAGENFVHQFCHDWAVNQETALGMIAQVANHLGEDDARSPQSATHSPGTESVGPSGAEVMRMFKRLIRVIRCSRGYQERSDKLEYAILALGWVEELDGVDNPTALAHKLNVTKQNADKYVNLFRDIIPPGMKTIPAMNGQRREDSRVLFTGIRYDQQKAKGKQG